MFAEPTLNRHTVKCRSQQFLKSDTILSNLLLTLDEAVLILESREAVSILESSEAVEDVLILESRRGERCEVLLILGYCLVGVRSSQ